MKSLGLICLYFLVSMLTTTAVAGVTVQRPASGATVTSPVNYVASATSGCSKGVASMGVYVDNNLVYVVNASTLNTSLTIGLGGHKTVVEEWDYCGGASYTPVAITVTNQTGVWITSPSNNATVGTPVQYVASGTAPNCGKGVASMGIYVSNQLDYTVSGASLNTYLMLYPGTYDTVVEEWDYCGGAAFTHVTVNVPGKYFSNLQSSGGWTGYGEYPPAYNICQSCGGGVTWSLNQKIGSPSITNNATKFSIGGTTPYADVLWTNPLIGDFSSQGLPDLNHAIIPNLANFTYDIYFYGSHLELSQALEFDINQYFNGMGYTWGHECRIAGGHEFDVWDNVNAKWIPTGIPCHPVDNGWNHLTLQVHRTWDNKLQYHSITLNGVTSIVDWYYPPFSVGTWYGVTANYQMDGNYQQAPYTAFVDKFTLTYW
jgi:hypothetical protein